MGTQSRTVEQKLAALATAKRGVLTRAELLRAGVSDRQIRRRVEKGLLILVHRGVYRVGHTAPSFEATYLAAVKACGTEAYLHHHAAAYTQGLLPLTRKPPPPAVMCATERSVPGVRTKRCRKIHPLEVCTHKGIPMTTVPRTLLDLAATATDDELTRACHEAWIKHRVGLPHVQAVLARHPRAKGVARLRRVMGGEASLYLSKLERGFAQALRRAGIELPETNVQVDEHYVDCRWRGRATVELDSFAFHNTRRSWEQGHRRRRAARDRGEEFRQYTWTDVFEHREPMLAEISSLLASR